MKRIINWFRNKVNRAYFVAGGEWFNRYEGWNYGKIGFILSLITIITLLIIFL